MSDPKNIFDRYLAILDVQRSKPSWNALAELTSAHLIRIPFENISKIHRARIQGIRCIPSLDEFLDGVEQSGLGGTCYVTNYYLYLLLDNLGYNIRLCGADILSDNTQRDGHMVSIVTIDGKEAMIDVGYGAPFLDPIPRDIEAEITIQLGNERYVFRPKDDMGVNRLEHYRGEKLKHGYLLKPASRSVRDFAAVIKRSYQDDAFFLNNLVIIRFYNNRSLVLRNNTFTESYGLISNSKVLDTTEKIIDELDARFGIPRNIAEEVVYVLSELDTFKI